MEEFSEVLHHQINVNDFRDFVEDAIEGSNINISENILKAKDIIRTIPISSAEAERGFSAMNLIATDTRNRISPTTFASLLTIVLLGRPVELWDPIPHVKTWLRKHHRADDARVKKKTPIVYSENQLAIWSFV